uniref:Dolichyl-diphosphooligosaccharide--protein glycosyltransferase subunit 1 n=1 Tax=Mesocestoides corti TaxID=53468 RepID=A0A5K3EYR5_MESCO
KSLFLCTFRECGAYAVLFRARITSGVVSSFSLILSCVVSMTAPTLVLLSFLVAVSCGHFTNNEVVQTIVADTHILRVDAEVTIDVPDVVSGNYHYTVDPDIYGHLSFIEAKDDSGIPLAIENLGQISNKPTFSISVPNKNSNKSVTFTVSSFFTRMLKPKPAQIFQADKQFVELVVNLAYYSAYSTKRVTSTVILSAGEVLFYSSDVQPVKRSASKIKYGPFENLPPFHEQMARFNYENSSPFLVVTNLERTIEVSHWGNIAVENKISMKHYGAKLIGSFSRLDYQRGIGHKTSVASIKAVLPASARDIYYRDEIGNISTSNVRSLYDSVEVELAPRFPLFGGWKTFFIFGYSIPAHESLYRKGDHFGLKMSFVDYLYENQLIDEMTLRIVLPETVSNVRLEAPFEVKRLPDEVLKTYLDTSGRTVLVIQKTNLVEGHIQDFVVYYDFSMMSMFREPAMVIAAFLLLFTAVIIYARLDFSLSEDQITELQQRVQASVDEVLNLHNQRSAIYQTYEDVISNYKANKDTDRFKAEQRKVEAEYRAISQKITALQTKLREFWVEGADKIGELQQLDQEYHGLLNKGFALAESAIIGKISKPQYQTEDSNLSSKKVGLIEKMEAIAESL